MDLVRRLILIAHNFGLGDEPIPAPLRKELMDGLHFIGELFDSMDRDWVIVPREATNAMHYAWMDVYDEKGWNANQSLWNALLIAAPRYGIPYTNYKCLDCGSWKLVQDGNRHPYCGCGSDRFDWSNPQEPVRLASNADVKGDKK